MAGINQGQPEVAVGEPIRFGDIDGFELEQHPVSDRLIIRDTENGTVAYVRAERGGQIGGDGVLIKALKESKPMADTGRTYDTIQEAERAASSWVFVPPGTYNESVKINTQGLTLQGSGYNTLIDGGSKNAINSNAENVRIYNLSAQTPNGTSTCVSINKNSTIRNIYLRQSTGRGIQTSSNCTILNTRIESCDGYGIRPEGSGGVIVSNCHIGPTNASGITANASSIISNNIVVDTGVNGIWLANGGENSIVVGNRIHNSANDGFIVTGNDAIFANNRVSNSGALDIDDGGTGTLLDGNLTGASN